MYNCVCVVVRYILCLCFTLPRCVERDSVALFFESLRAVIIRYDIQCNGTVYVDGFRCHPFTPPAHSLTDRNRLLDVANIIHEHPK